MFRRTAAVLLAACLAGPASAHELWLDAEDWTVEPNQEIVVAVRNGMDFAGNSLPWLTRSIARAEIFTDGDSREIEGRLGDRPAITTAPLGEGLNTVLYRTNPVDLTYDGFDKFQTFLEEKGNAAFLDTHAERDLPENNVTEVYTRFTKALVGVGDGAGADAYRDMEIELVAETNPYTAELPGEMTVRLFYRGEPLADHRVTLFDRSASGDVTRGEATTDAEGRASFTVAPGHTYLADAVVVREPEVTGPGGKDAMWESLWAALTFAVPE
ncbi:DUF4198 domain-containing protein [Roseivivax marinus]|uniref:DUF4198 domain-containing protein n=1 Tax=Roseivivax marinus TaxID=1379903 RepID=UPI001F03F349|nr:DUF4198 domain-containing protein [Roseivivax marinus]UMA65282.1 DUF4198 domain-containing protein [Roseivivax marinus]